MNIGTKKSLILLLIFCCIISPNVFSQRKISFVASDNLIVTADLYLLDKSNPYIILLHQENSSRGEYRDIAPRLQKLGFNCIAVDLRYGKESNFIQNETASQAQKAGIQVTAIDCEKDILAAIDYISKTTTKNKYILLGSSFSASLALKIANHNRYATAAIAFSPGEYFGPLNLLKNWVKDYDKLVYTAVTTREYPFTKDLLVSIPQDKLTLFKPSSGEGVHGAPALWNDNPTSNEYWMSLMMFIKKVKETEY